MASWTWEGDLEAAIQWYPLAITELKSLRSLGVASRTFNPAEGVEIRIKSFPPHVHIKASGSLTYYMETGFYNLYSIHPKHEGTYRPPYLHFNDDVRAYQDNTNDSIIGEITYAKGRFKGDDEFDERSSLSFNCDDPVASITFIVFEEYVVYSNSTPIWCNTEAFRARKVCQMLVKPSVFTGKLRLFVQALYGSFRYDYSTVEETPFIDKPFFVGDLQIQYQYLYGSGGSGTHGIYTNEHLDYYLIHIKPSTISARRMIPKKEGKWILSNLRKQVEKGTISKEDRAKIEAYLLSTCEIDNEERTIATFDQLQGTPLHYGWHFNWNGSQADIVLITDNVPNDKLLYATHYRFSISDKVRGNLVCELSSNFKDMPWYGVGNKIVWTPNPLMWQMVAKVNPMPEELGFGWDISNPLEWEAYIYCYYDVNDEFTLVGLSNKTDPGGYKPQEYFISCGELSGFVPYQTAAYTEPSSNISKVGVYDESGGALYEYSYDTKPLMNGQSFEYFIVHGLGEYEAPYPIGQGGTSDYRSLDLYDMNQRVCNGMTWGAHAISLGLINPDVIKLGSSSGYTINVEGEERIIYITYNMQPNYPVDFYRTIGSEGRNIMHTIAIPYWDAEMVFIGEQIHNNWNMTQDAQIYKDGFITANVIYNTWYLKPGTAEKVLLNTYGPFACRATRIYGADIGDGAPYPWDTEVLVKLGTPAHQDIIDVEADDWYQYSAYFSCAYVTDPNGYFYAEHRQSVRGAANPVYTYIIDEDDGYIYHTAVGWA